MEEVVCNIRIPGASIKEKRIQSNPSLSIVESATNDSVRVQLASLNPEEKVQISILASAPKNLPLNPEVSIRAKGVSGLLKDEKAPRNNSTVSVLSALLGVATGFLFLVEKKTSGKKLSGDQREVLAYLCFINGLDEEAQKLLAESRKTTYWIQADRMTFEAIRSKSKGRCEKTRNVILAIPSVAGVASESVAVLFLNAAKLESFLGNEERATELAQLAVSKHSAITEVRAAIDEDLRRVLAKLKDSS